MGNERDARKIVKGSLAVTSLAGRSEKRHVARYPGIGGGTGISGSSLRVSGAGSRRRAIDF